MKKVLIFGIILFLAYGCGSKKISVKSKTAIEYYNKYMTLYFEGKIKSSENLFNKALKEFISTDEMCNVSRLYLSKYVIELPKKELKTLKIAGNYAKLSNCQNELNIFNFLAGKNFSIDELEEPYKSYALYENTNKIDVLLNAVGNNDLSEYAKSRLFRFTAKELLLIDVNRAESYLEEALKIDKFNGWTLLIIKDLKIKLEICKFRNKNCNFLEKRIKLINKSLAKN
jgi:hypothetical protein